MIAFVGVNAKQQMLCPLQMLLCESSDAKCDAFPFVPCSNDLGHF